jgi:hypothetical protein
MTRRASSDPACLLRLFLSARPSESEFGAASAERSGEASVRLTSTPPTGATARNRPPRGAFLLLIPRPLAEEPHCRVSEAGHVDPAPDPFASYGLALPSRPMGPALAPHPCQKAATGSIPRYITGVGTKRNGGPTIIGTETSDKAQIIANSHLTSITICLLLALTQHEPFR